MKESNSFGKFIGLLLTVVAIGGVLGIILAPRKGRKTRKIISKKSSEFKEELKEKFNDMLMEIRNEVETINEKENELLEMDSQNWRS